MLRLEMLSEQGVFCSYKYYKQGFTIYVSVRMYGLDWYWKVTTVSQQMAALDETSKSTANSHK